MVGHLFKYTMFEDVHNHKEIIFQLAIRRCTWVWLWNDPLNQYSSSLLDAHCGLYCDQVRHHAFWSDKLAFYGPFSKQWTDLMMQWGRTMKKKVESLLLFYQLKTVSNVKRTKKKKRKKNSSPFCRGGWSRHSSQYSRKLSWLCLASKHNFSGSYL